MSDTLHDQRLMAAVLRRRVLRVIPAAIRKLARVAHGRDGFDSDHQLRACVTLARLAPVFIAAGASDAGADDVTPCRMDDPAWWTPERDLDFRRLDWLQLLTPEQRVELDARREALLKAWEAAQPPADATLEQKQEHWRVHGIHHISEVDEALWPDDLKTSTLEAKQQKGADHD